jgi:hypothetical protein
VGRTSERDEVESGEELRVVPGPVIPARENGGSAERWAGSQLGPDLREEGGYGLMQASTNRAARATSLSSPDPRRFCGGEAHRAIALISLWNQVVVR